MADDDLVDLVGELAAKCSAYELVLVDLIFSTWPLEVHRNERRESACRLLEGQLTTLEPSSHGYLFLQRALAAIEDLYNTPGPPSGAETP